MQADYTKKTMAAADERKAATAETQKAQQERATYAQNLQEMQIRLEGALQEQSKAIDWEQLLNSDPVEYLKQQHLVQSRPTAKPLLIAIWSSSSESSPPSSQNGRTSQRLPPKRLLSATT